MKHAWDVTPVEAVALQRALAGRVRHEPAPRDVSVVAGVDCAFVGGGERILAAAVACDAGTMEVVESVCVERACEFPYVSGLLSFREAPAVLEAIGSLGVEVDLVLLDGQGVAHPRRLGLASHVGLWLGKGTIGVAKSRLVGLHDEPGRRRGDRAELTDAGEAIGAVVRTRDDVRPLYVSVGHLVTLDDAVAWTLRCGRGVRLPEPTRRAHQAVTRAKGQGR
jgi:deoxyribonuclease V